MRFVYAMSYTEVYEGCDIVLVDKHDVMTEQEESIVRRSLPTSTIYSKHVHPSISHINFFSANMSFEYVQDIGACRS